MVILGFNANGEKVLGDAANCREVHVGNKVVAQATFTGDPANYFADDRFKTCEEKFLGELADAVGKTNDDLRRDGIDKLIPGYLNDMVSVSEAAVAYVDSRAAARLSTGHVVIYSEELGVYLGGAMGMGFWSKLDSCGQPAACTFPSEEEARRQIATLAEGAFPKDVRFVPVVPDDDGYASIAACVRAGLPGWIDDLTPAANQSMC